MRRIKKRYLDRRLSHTRLFIIRETSAEQIDRLLRTSTYWRRHPAPFNKTRRGLQRRVERLFKRDQLWQFFERGTE